MNQDGASESSRAAPGPTALPAAPPTIPGKMAVPIRDATWPSTVGIISIVLGSLSCLFAVWSVIQQAMVLAGTFNMMMPAGGPGSPDLQNVMRTGAWPQLFAGCIQFILALVLLGLGIALLRRKAVAIRGLMYWSIAKILLSLGIGILTAWVQIRMSEQIAAAMNADPNAPPQMTTVMPTIFWLTSIFSALLTFAWGAAWPTFLLLWMTRTPVRAEVARWRAPSSR